MSSERQELIVVRRDGCMAHIFTIVDRGTIVGKRSQATNRAPIEMYVCRRADGSEFTAIVERCQGPKHDGDVSKRLGEDASGKIIEFV